MNKTITIKDTKQQKHAVACVLDLPFDPIHQIIIKPFKETLSDRQRRFYFLWCGLMAKEFGYTKDEMHETLKGKYLFPIMLQHPDDYPRVDRLVEQVRAVRAKGMQKEADQIARDVAEMVSITDALVPHMGEYLDEIYGLARENNINLPMPEDRYK
jgi:hypothetical protein